jgi:hypothetical protein
MALKTQTIFSKNIRTIIRRLSKFCDDNSMNASKRIRKYIENDVEAWKKKAKQINK